PQPDARTPAPDRRHPASSPGAAARRAADRAGTQRRGAELSRGRGLRPGLWGAPAEARYSARIAGPAGARDPRGARAGRRVGACGCRAGRGPARIYGGGVYPRLSGAVFATRPGAEREGPPLFLRLTAFLNTKD